MYNISRPITRNIINLDFKEEQLENGLNVILHKDNTNPIVSVDIWYHVGSKDEEVGKTGFAHLFEHIMFQGSKNVKKAEHFKYVQHAGGIANGSTTQDRTNYFESLPSNQLDLALWLESDRMAYLNVNQENFDNQREVVKEEKRQRNDNVPYGTKWFHLFKNAFRGEPYEWVPIGSMEDLNNATLNDALDFYEKYYSPSNAALVISGDIEYEETFEQARKYFGDIRNNTIEKKKFPVLNFNAGEVKDFLYDSVHIPALFIGYKIPGVISPEIPSIELLSTILAESKSSRLYTNIVHKKKLAKSASCFVWGNELGGLLVISCIGLYNSDLYELEKNITEEVENLIVSAVSESELEKAKNNLESYMVDTLQTNIGKAEFLAFFKTYFKNTGMINTVLEKYTKITVNDIKMAAAKYLASDNRVVLYYLDKDHR